MTATATRILFPVASTFLVPRNAFGTRTFHFSCPVGICGKNYSFQDAPLSVMGIVTQTKRFGKSILQKNEIIKKF
jgi:hypothetical protein